MHKTNASSDSSSDSSSHNLSHSLFGKIALVTGASRGIGAATAIELARAGAHVIITARSIAGLEETDDAIRNISPDPYVQENGATILPLNLTDLSAVEKIGPGLYERFSHLDIFVANAGMLGTLGPIGHSDAKEFDRVMAVNLHANYHLIRSLHPLLERSQQAGNDDNTDTTSHNTDKTGPARALFITGEITRAKNAAYFGAYMASKCGLQGLVKSYADECAKQPICVNMISPSLVNTKMYRQVFPGGDETAITQPATIATKIRSICDNTTPTQNGDIIRI